MRALAGIAPDWELVLIVGRNRDPQQIDVESFGANAQVARLPFSDRTGRGLQLAGLLPRLERTTGDVDAVLGPSYATWPARAPTVMVVHDLAYVRYPSFVAPKNLLFLRAVMRRSVRRSAMVATVTATMQAEVTAHYGVAPERTTVIPNGCDHEVFRPAARRPDLDLPESFLLAVGTLEPRKNLSGVLAAHRALRARWPDAPDLVVAGGPGWRTRGLGFEIDELNQTPGVKWLGFASDETLAGLYSNALALVLPSHYEGFGLPVLEAMASGCPVVTSRRGGLPEVAGDAALYVDPDDVTDISSGMERVARDPTLRETIRSKGFERARAYTWDAAGHALKATIERAAVLSRSR